MAKKLAEFTDRHAAHAALAQHLEENPTSKAECREDPNTNTVCVFDGPDERVPQGHAHVEESSVTDSTEEITVKITGRKHIEAFQRWQKFMLWQEEQDAKEEAKPLKEEGK